MRANIPNELLNAIDDKIYLDLEINVLNSRLHKAEQEGNEGFAEFLNKLILKVITERRNVNQYLRDNGVTVYEVVEIDEYFVEYPYSQKLNGGYKEGRQRYWRSAIKLNLKKRMSKYFNYKGG